MNERDLKIAEKFKFLVSQRVKVHEVRVFGSRARVLDILAFTQQERDEVYWAICGLVKKAGKARSM